VLSINKILAIATRLAGGGVQILSVFLISRILGLEYVGAFSLAQSFAILLGGVISGGLPNYLIHKNSIHFNTGNLKAFRDLFGKAGLYIVSGGLLLQSFMLLFVLIFSNSLLKGYENTFILAWSPLMGIFFALTALVVMNLRATHRYILANLLDRPLIGFFTVSVFLLLIYLSTNMNHAAVIAMVMGGSLVAVLGIWRVFKAVPLGATEQKTLPKEPYDWPLVARYFTALIVEVLLSRATLVVASFFYLIQALGLFQVAFTLGIGLVIFQEALGGILGPTFAIAYAKADFRALQLLNLKTIALLSGVTVLYALPFLLFPQTVIGLFNEELAKNSEVFFVILGAIAVRNFCGLYRSIFEAVGLIHYSFRISIVALIVLIVSLFAFKSFGAMGLAMAWAMATALHSVLGLFTCLYVLHSLKKKVE
jgi:O-antigen/teichoic acid export membrane protein